jgi:hypothetical protein
VLAKLSGRRRRVAQHDYRNLGQIFASIDAAGRWEQARPHGHDERFRGSDRLEGKQSNRRVERRR